MCHVHGRGAPRRQDTASQEAALETYRALPAPDHVYSDYDFEIIAEIISLAEQQAQALARKGKGECAGAQPCLLLLQCYLVGRMLQAMSSLASSQHVD